jgi:phosphoenolpyruvate carboxykinase (ATP)
MENNGPVRNQGLPKIQMPRNQTSSWEVCHDDSTPPVRAQTIDELHSLQKKRSAPTTPIRGAQGAFAPMSEEARQKQQLQSIR